MAHKFVFKILIIFSLQSGLSLGNVKYLNQSTGKNPSLVYVGYSSLVFQDMDPRDGSAALIVYANQIKKNFSEKYKLSADFRAKVYYSIEEIKADLRDKKLNYLSVPTDQYFELKKSNELEPCLATVSHNNKFTQYVIISSAAGSIKKITDLKGKSVSIPKNFKGWLVEKWLDVVLNKNKLKNAESCFSSLKYLDSEAKAVYDVFFNKVDAAIVRKSVFTTLVEMNPQLEKSILFIESSPPILSHIVMYEKNSDLSVMEKIVRVTSELHLSKEGKQLLDIFKFNRLEKITEKDLKSVKDIVDEYNKLTVSQKKN